MGRLQTQLLKILVFYHQRGFKNFPPFLTFHTILTKLIGLLHQTLRIIFLSTEQFFLSIVLQFGFNDA